MAHIWGTPGHGGPGARGEVRGFSAQVAVRVQAAMFAGGGVFGALGVALPHPARFDEGPMLAIQALCLVSAALLLLIRDRPPAWLPAAGAFAATLATAAVLFLTHSSSSPYLLFYLWVALYGFAFLPTGQAIALSAFGLVTFAAVLAGFQSGTFASPGDNSNEDVAAAVLLGGTLAVAGAFVVLLRDRVGGLIAQLSAAVSTDPLTGLLNRRAFGDAVAAELARSERNGQPFSLLVGDCDFFKELNDALGRQAGDAALQEIGRRIEEDRRRIDVAARTGGEEFALVLPETDQHEAYLVAERLRMGVTQAFAESPSGLTMSWGVVTCPDHATDAETLLRAADDALYAAKALGRDRCVLYSAEIAGILSSGRQGKSQRDRAQLTTVLNLAEALDMRDSGTARHSQTVGRYSGAMAGELGLTREHADRVRIAGVLHDIGKIGVPDSILCKPGALTAEEYGAMKKHPEIGARILGGSGLDDIREWVLAHHERPDGSGYPAGHAGEEIPLEARILAVADAYEAMTSDRVYRKSIGATAARGELLACAGRQFDADVVHAFLRTLDRASETPATAPTDPARSAGSAPR